MAELLYGTGMRLSECLELRVKDVDFGAGQVVVRGMVWLPFAFKEKCPSAEKAWGWPYAFPGPSLWRDPRDGLWKRHHCHESPLQTR